MIVFWLALFGLMLIAVLLLLWPMSTRYRGQDLPITGDTQTYRTQTNISLYAQRLADIDEEVQQGVIDTETAALLRQELKKQLLDDATVPLVATPGVSPRKTLWVLWTALVLPVAALLFYSKTGEPEAWTLPVLIKQSERAYDAGIDNTPILQRLADQLSAFPDRTDFIALQARILMQLQQYSDAETVYATLLQQFPDDALLMGQSVQARYLANGRQFNDSLKQDALLALKREPEQPVLLGLLGMYAFEQNRYSEAVKFWEMMTAVLPPESAQLSVIQGPLERARALAKEESVDPLRVDAHQVSHEAAAESLLVRVNVELPTVPENTTLFVFAKSAESGASPMPLAVQRIANPVFPLTVKLDDSLAMMPTLKMSAVETVIVTARLSTSGDVKGHEGDYEVSSMPIQWRQVRSELELILR